MPNIAPSGNDPTLISLPEGVRMRDQNYFTYQDYNISKQTDGSWELYDDHGTNIGFPDLLYVNAAKAGDWNLAIEGMIKSCKTDAVVRERVAAEDLAYQAELARESAPLMQRLHEISARSEPAPFLARLFAGI